MKVKCLIIAILLILIPVMIVETSPKGIELIKEAEGFSPKPYLCPAGVWTIGYGHAQKIDRPITKEFAEELLKKDLKKAEQSIERLVKVPLNINQFSALVSLVFNIGEGAFANSTLLRALNEGNFQAAADQFNRWVYAGGKIQKGLQTRRQSEKNLFLA